MRSWTTSVGAFGIGQASGSSISGTRAGKAGCHLVTARDVWRGFWFQLAARIILLFNKDSGDECVLMATRK